MGKRVLSLFLAIIMLLSIFSTSVFALTSTKPVGWEYDVSNSKATVTAYTGAAATVTVPETIDSYTVEKIAANAFKDTTIKVLNLPETLTTLSKNALSDSSVQSVYVPISCIVIGAAAIPAGVTVYGIKKSTANTFANSNSLTFVSVSDKAVYNSYVGKTIALSVPNGTTLASKKGLNTVNGKNVKAKATGTDIISVTFSNGIVGNVKVDIKAAPKSISNVPNSLKLYSGEKYQLSPKFSNGTYDEKFRYGTTASAIATVTASGLIQAKKVGKVNIIVASAGLKATCALTVLKKPTSVKLSASDILLGVGESKNLSYKLGFDETAKSVTYFSNNTAVATITSKGKVTGKKVGTTRVKITLDNGLSDSCVVTVGKAPSSIEISRTKFTMGVGERIKLYPTVNSGAVCSTYIWKSVTPSVATVDNNGVVTAKKTGKVLIAVYPYNFASKTPSIKAVATVTVKKAPQKLSYNRSAITLGVGETFDLDIKYPAGTASCYNLTKIGNKKVATYSKALVINAKSVGKTAITTTTFNKKVAKCVITVKKAPIKVACKVKALKLSLKQSYQLRPYVNASSACSHYRYSSGNPKVCTVSSGGKITIKGNGVCNVYIYTYNHTKAHPVFTKVLVRVGGITNKVSTFTTYFDTSMTGKAHNLMLACKYINGKTNGYILQPGEVFSYNAAVGPRTSARGFVEGLVVDGTDYSPAIGGGICQGATTVFNAALLGNFDIVERHNHNLKSSYVPVGRDATVYWGVQDCKIKNNLKTPIRIKMTYSSGGAIACSIFSFKKVKTPNIDLKVSYSGGEYILRRYANGKVNYTAYSKYAN